MRPAAEHVGRRHDDQRLPARADETRIEVGQQRALADEREAARDGQMPGLDGGPFEVVELEHAAQRHLTLMTSPFNSQYGEPLL